MHIAWFDVVGTSGVALVLLAYYLLQTGRWSGHSLPYLMANLVGSVLLAVSLLYTFNLASFIIELAWIAISVYGILRRRHAPPA